MTDSDFDSAAVSILNQSVNDTDFFDLHWQEDDLVDSIATPSAYNSAQYWLAWSVKSEAQIAIADKWLAKRYPAQHTDRDEWRAIARDVL